MRRIIAVIITLLIVITASLLIIQSNQNSKAEYTLIPNFILESPENNTVIYGTDSLNITLTWETVFGYEYYYSIDVPIVANKPDGKIPLNLTIASENPLPNNNSEKTYQCIIELQNLTNGQHSLTLYYSGYDPIISTWKYIKPGTTIVFSIDNLVTPSPKPTPTVPEFSWLVILPLFLSLLFIVVFFRKRKLSEGYD